MSYFLWRFTDASLHFSMTFVPGAYNAGRCVYANTHPTPRFPFTHNYALVRGGGCVYMYAGGCVYTPQGAYTQVGAFTQSRQMLGAYTQWVRTIRRMIGAYRHPTMCFRHSIPKPV
jgi:hypothetical protein